MLLTLDNKECLHPEEYFTTITPFSDHRFFVIAKTWQEGWEIY